MVQPQNSVFRQRLGGQTQDALLEPLTTFYRRHPSGGARRLRALAGNEGVGAAPQGGPQALSSLSQPYLRLDEDGFQHLMSCLRVQ